MLVYQFTVPLLKRSTVFEDKIAYEFGGFTRTLGVGFWKNLAGKTEEENIAIYTVAVNVLTDGFRLRGMVRDFLRERGEQAMYFAEIGTAQIEFLSGDVPALAKE